jgi:exopolyphosphatase/guanosine-5'-triphosphate,3'-diphosphate pyrophosphatase
LLHDVSWRAHPDYRAEVCFDNATRANLGGLKHAERVFMGLALLHRYKNSRDGTRFDDLFELLDDRSKQQAEVLGKAMRLGAMLWMRDADGMAKLKWSPKKKILTLSLPKSALALFGEVAEARLSSLGTALGATEVLVKHTK